MCLLKLAAACQLRHGVAQHNASSLIALQYEPDLFHHGLKPWLHCEFGAKLFRQQSRDQCACNVRLRQPLGARELLRALQRAGAPLLGRRAFPV